MVDPIIYSFSLDGSCSYEKSMKNNEEINKLKVNGLYTCYNCGFITQSKLLIGTHKSYDGKFLGLLCRQCVNRRGDDINLLNNI